MIIRNVSEKHTLSKIAVNLSCLNPGPPPSDSSFVHVGIFLKFQPKLSLLHSQSAFLAFVWKVPDTENMCCRYSLNQLMHNTPFPISVAQNISPSSSTIHTLYFLIPQTVSHRAIEFCRVFCRRGKRCGECC